MDTSHLDDDAVVALALLTGMRVHNATKFTTLADGCRETRSDRWVLDSDLYWEESRRVKGSSTPWSLLGTHPLPQIARRWLETLEERTGCSAALNERPSDQC